MNISPATPTTMGSTGIGSVVDLAKIDQQAALKEFQEKGYYLYRNFFERQDAIDAGRWLKAQDPTKFAKTWTDQEPGVPLAVWQGIQYTDSPIGKIATDPKVLDFASLLMGERAYVWSSKVNVKAAWCGTAEYYHQDFVYWVGRGYQSIDMLSCMQFVDKHDIYNAGLHVIPGTHKYGFLHHDPFININGLSKFMIPPKKMDELHEKHGLVVIDAEPGDALFFHAGLIHGSSHNISPRSRMIILSQLSLNTNKAQNVQTNAKQFNLDRAERELHEAERRLKWFQEKYENQRQSCGVEFNAPIPPEEV